MPDQVELPRFELSFEEFAERLNALVGINVTVRVTVTADERRPWECARLEGLLGPIEWESYSVDFGADDADFKAAWTELYAKTRTDFMLTVSIGSNAATVSIDSCDFKSAKDGQYEWDLDGGPVEKSLVVSVSGIRIYFDYSGLSLRWSERREGIW